MSSESQTTVECPSCDGTGQFWQNGSPWRCNGCHGTGRLPIEDQPDNSQTAADEARQNVYAWLHVRVNARNEDVRRVAVQRIAYWTDEVLQHDE